MNDGRGSAGSHQISLAEAFKRQKETLVHRASAVFPVRLRAGTSLTLVFLDYWKLKNGIAGVACNIRVYDAEGVLAARSSRRIGSAHNAISMRDILGDQDFDGMVEIEIMASDNLGYAFPAITGLYEADGAYSIVHSAGRIKNPDEVAVPAMTDETNWSCKSGEDVSPFFHIFNGPRQQDNRDVSIGVYDANNAIVAEASAPLPAKPFASALMILSDIFEESALRRTFRTSLRFSAAETFPRLVVGNLHRRNDHLEATHSFPQTTIADYIAAPPGEVEVRSFLAGVTVPELELEVVSFPTNAESMVEAKVRRQTFRQDRLNDTAEAMSWATGGEQAGGLKLRLGDEDRLLCLDFESGQIPSRLNASYRYRVRGVRSAYSTDFALGAKSWVYPPKHTHWGHGLLGGGFETVLLFWNIAHDRSRSVDEIAKLTVYWGDHGEAEYDVAISADSGGAVYLGRLCGQLAQSADVGTLSWVLRTENPSVDTFYVAFAEDGRICGEHGF